MAKEQGIKVISTIKEAAVLYFKNFPLLFTIMIIMEIPIFGYMFQMGLMTKNPENPVYAIMFFATMAAATLLAVAGWNASVSAFSSLYKGEKTGLGIAYKVGFKRYFRSLAAGILYILIAMGGTVLLIIPGLIFIITYMFAIPVAVLEDVKVSPLKMSAKLSRNNKWQLFAIFLLLYIVVCGPAFLISYLSGAYADPVKSMDITYLLLSSIPGILLGQLFTGALVIAYEKLKEVKKDEIKPEELKGLSTPIGCLVSALILVGVMVVGVIVGVVVGKSAEAIKNKAAIESSSVTETE
ncbi:MAG: hypothetical protein CVV21_03705 [Candidatus Goldiibacteriota bacterium HGW-Goldbacteria-1]|jgi:hypothetical protein|nr:MAG: hypothetical protein CVV21_03705 [Candidatus Goldiibacteriota bacterium HGW-Goldbacteria-1]